MTYIIQYPRPIHSEIMTHRMLTKSSASSRAIPTGKLIERVLQDPWIPKYIGMNQKGMQPGDELSGDARQQAEKLWLAGRDFDVKIAEQLAILGVHKGVVNRRLEANMWITVIISGTEWDNFFGLRCHEMAEPHFQEIARMMRQARDASTPKELAQGQWHLPLIFEEDWQNLINQARIVNNDPDGDYRQQVTESIVKISVGRCARVSYLNHDGVRDYNEDIALHDKLMRSRPLHAAPAEHVAQAMDWPSWLDDVELPTNVYELRQAVIAERKQRIKYNERPSQPQLRAEAALGQMQSGNYLGFAQYRKTLADENIGGLMA